MKYFLLLSIFFAYCALSASQTNNIVCYYGSWATYRNGNGQVSVEDIDPNLCSHIIHSFVGLNTDGTVKILDPWNDINNRAIERLVNLKNINPQLKVLVAIGGWNEGSEKYSRVVNSPSLRTKFVNSIVSFTLQYNLDGFDLDWEYPGQRGGAPSDREAFVELIKELRSKFDEHGLMLTAAVGVNEDFIRTSYDVPNLSKYLDNINLMTYDFHGSYDGITGQCSPLYASKIDRNPSLNVDRAIQNWIAAGADPKKIILGVASYGRSYTLSNSDNNGLGASTSGPGSSGPYSQEPGMLTYLEICENQKRGGWITVWDDEQKNPYTYRGNQWVGYDNVESVTLKAKYAVEQKLGGVMVWSIESDDVRGVCGDGQYPLIKALGQVIDITSSNTTTSSQTSTAASPSTSSSTSTSTTSASTASETTSPPSSTTTESSTTPSSSCSTTDSSTSIPETTSTETTSSTSLTTSKPNGNICTEEGYVGDPEDCSVFYVCQKRGNGFRADKLQCPRGLFFDESINSCNYPQLTECYYRVFR